MNKLIQQQEDVADKIMNLQRNYNKDSDSRKTKTYLEGRIASLRSLYQEYVATDDKIRDIVPPVDSNHPYFITRKQILAIYESFINEMRERLHNGPPRTPTTSMGDLSLISQIPNIHISDEYKPGPSSNQPQRKQQENVERNASDNPINRLFKRQDVLMRQLYHKMAAINDVLDTQNQPKEYLQLKINQLQKGMDEIDQLHTSIMIDSDEENQMALYFKDDYYGTLQDKVDATVIRLIQGQAQPTSTLGCHKVQLPKLDIPYFSGDYEHWSSFNDIFSEIIDRNGEISNTVKMTYLKTHVQKGAAQLISHLSTVGDNYEAAWGLLQSRYNNPRLLATKYFNSLLSLPTAQFANVNALKNLHDTAKEMLHNIERLNICSPFESFIAHILFKKLDPESARLYETTLDNPREIPKMADFFKFTERRFQSLEAMGNTKLTSVKTTMPASPIRGVFSTTTAQCWVKHCKRRHQLEQCEQFRKMLTLDRSKLVNVSNLCVRCLSKHDKSPCNSAACMVCNGRHHTLLHCNNAASSSQTSAQTLLVNQPGIVLLPTALIRATAGKGQFVTLRALIDSGSQATLISSKAAKKLNATRRKTNVNITGIGGNAAGVCNHTINVNLASQFSDEYMLNIDALIFNKLSQQLPETNVDTSKWKHLDELQLADPRYNLSQPIDLVIGADYYPMIITDKIIKGKPHEPMAQHTEFGWIIIGALRDNNQRSLYTMTTTKAIEEQLKLFVENDNIPEDRTRTEEEIKVEEHFQSTAISCPDGRFMVRIPFRSDPSTLGESRKTAAARLLQLERKFARNAAFKQMYHQFMQDYIDLKHMELIETEIQPAEVSSSYYIPHHGVLKHDSTTTKLRVVFDASAKTTTGVSLNDLMMTGPKLQDDLTDILLRWRKHRFVMTADIEKMYRQVWIHDKDQNYQRILWRCDPAKPMATYRLKTVTYGTTAASYLAVRALLQLAQDGSIDHPKAAQILSSDFYVDDLLTGADSIEEAVTTVAQLRSLAMVGGLNLRKWTSNSKKILEHIPNHAHHLGSVNIQANDQVKTLGLAYHPSTDLFEFDVSRLQLSDRRPTKRTLLSESSKLFDPIGWLSPLTITAKLMMQEAWASGIGWDDQLPTKLSTKWMTYKEETAVMNQITIPRWIGTTRSSTIELHGFSDASESAYAAVVYSRAIDDAGCITTQLIMSKTRVAPIKIKLSIPRLELNAAYLLAKLIKHIQGAMDLHKVKSYAWCDSTIVLCWVNGEPSRFKTFVANRISAIKSILPTTTWHHVKSHANPADIASRGTTPAILANHQLWWKGPDFLYHESVLSNEQFIAENVLDERQLEALEQKVLINLTSINQTNPFLKLFERHSSFNKLKRIIAYCKRFIHYKSSACKSSEVLSNIEAQEAETTIIKIIQKQDFHDEIHCLHHARPLSRKSRLVPLNPYLDENGILRVNGRLFTSHLEPASRNPIILAKNNIITQRIIEEAHRTTMHGGIQLTLAHLRHKYWIIDGKRAVRGVTSRCIKCFRHNQRITEQLMGTLPAARIQPGRAFAKTGIDYAGPIQIRTTKGRGHKSYKGYIALFICMVTKAIHIEVVSSLTTDSFIAAYKRFTSRRGLCTDIYSDNGTYFVAANTVLRSNLHTVLKMLPTDIAETLLNDETNWHFIPPHSPHFGGIWEAGIKSVKFHLKRVIGETTLTFEELYTVLTQIEACLNSRPLMPLSNDASDLSVLTPGHFLIGDSLKAPPPVNTESIGIKARWHMVEQMVQNFWKRWSSEYIHQLQQRTKWTRSQPNLMPNDLVLLKDDQLPTTRWKLGRIVDTHAGKDNLVRVATVKCKEATYKRPIVKLCKLPIEDQSAVEETASHTASHSFSNCGSPNNQYNETRRKQPHRQAKSLGCKSQLALTMFTVCCIFGLSQASIHDTPFTQPNGIYFEELGKLEIVAMKWAIVVHYNLSSYWKEIENFNQAHTEMGKICNELPNLNCNSTLQQLSWQYENLIADNRLLYESNKERRRVKRGFGDSVGLVLGDMFGILTQREAEKYEDHFEKINNNERHLLALIKNHTSIIDNTIKLVKHNNNLTRNTVNNLVNGQNRLREEMRLLQEYRTYEDRVRLVFTTMLEMTLILKNLEETQQGLLDALYHAHHKYIHPSILTPTQLEEELQVIRQHVPVTIALPGHNIHDLHHVYQTMNVRSRVTQGSVIIEIILPLSFAWDYTLMSVISVPDINHGRTQSSIITSIDYLAMDHQREHFALLTKEDVNRCQIFQPVQFLCEISPIINIQANKAQCELAILQRKTNLDSLCSTKTTISTNHWIKLHAPNQWIYVVPNRTTVDVICSPGIQSHTIWGSGIIEIEAGCVLRDSGIQIIAIAAAHHNFNKSHYIRSYPLHGATNLREFHTYIMNKTNDDIDLLNLADTTSLEDAITTLDSDETLPHDQNFHHVHHYTMIHVLFWSGLIIGFIWIINKIRRKPCENNQHPAALPRPDSDL